MAEEEYSTADMPPGRFQAHGEVSMHVEGCLIRYVARGPFNRELLNAYEREQELLLGVEDLPAVYADLTVFEHSAMTPLDTLNAYSTYLAMLREQQRAPLVTAYVLPPEVEGKRLMEPLFHDCYRQAGLCLELFDTEKEARGWIARCLADSGASGAVDPVACQDQGER